MDYYQGVVTEYLRANRATFVNTEFCIHIGPDQKSFLKDSHWFCDAVALSFEEQTIYLCEISFAVNPSALLHRLTSWSEHWDEVQTAVRSHGHLVGVLNDWSMRPWLFVPEQSKASVEGKLKTAMLKFDWKLTPLEETQPWKYRSWDRSIVANEICTIEPRV